MSEGAVTSRQGEKTYAWGPRYWTVLRLLAHHLNEEQLDPAFAEFAFLSPSLLLPCIFCRRSYTAFVAQPEFRVCWYAEHRRLPELVYLLHNAVNCKLGRPVVPQSVARRLTELNLTHLDHCWSPAFWLWIETAAFNFPRVATPPALTATRAAPKGEGRQQWRVGEPRVEGTAEKADEERRVAAYITFFTTLKSVLPAACEVSARWARAYFCHPPSARTFASRQALLRWVFDMERLCGHRGPDDTFGDMMQALFPILLLAATALVGVQARAPSNESMLIEKLAVAVERLQLAVERLQRDVEELRAPGATIDTNFVATATSNQFMAGSVRTTTLNFAVPAYTTTVTVPYPGTTAANLVHTGSAAQTITGPLTVAYTEAVLTISNTGTIGYATLEFVGGSSEAAAISVDTTGAMTFLTQQSGAGFIFGTSWGAVASFDANGGGLSLPDPIGTRVAITPALQSAGFTVFIPAMPANSNMVLTRGNATFLTDRGTTSMVIDSRNGRLGIGTASPAAPLHVQGGARFDTATTTTTVATTLTITNAGVSGAVPTSLSNLEQVTFTSTVNFGSYCSISNVPFKILRVLNRVSIFSSDSNTQYTCSASASDSAYLTFASTLPARFTPTSVVYCSPTYIYNMGALGTNANACTQILSSGSVTIYADSFGSKFVIPSGGSSLGWVGTQLVADYYI